MSETPLLPPSRRPRIGLVVKRSAWRIYLEERRDPRIGRLVEDGDPTVSRLRASHDAHEQTVREVRAALERLDAEVTQVRGSTQAFDARDLDLVVTVGGDGTLLSASHSVEDVPILGINSAPNHSVGFFCGARSGEAASAIEKALRGALRRAVLTRMQVTVNGKVVTSRVLNEALFCHTSPAATSRYLVRLGRVEEEQKSSGFWIGPAAGSTAAQRSAGGRVLPLTSKKLQLVVREPYTPHGEEYRLRHALIAPGTPLVVRSKMHEAKLFFDGPINCFDVGFGDVLEFTQAPRPLAVLGISTKRKWGPGSPASFHEG
ncbi:MAG TPA: NAD(+)/NADH kinase [Candidatus Nanopelagicales bacterium]|nr:NAD(+)/NADH kinase [Candidatus Nanopelagicales bacterium]